MAGFTTAAAIIGASVIGAGSSMLTGAANRGAAENMNAQNLAQYEKYFGKVENAVNPWITRGNTSADSLMALLGLGGDAGKAEAAYKNWLGSTDYNFRLNSGSDAVSSQRAAKGLLGSGSTLKALTSYGQQLGNQYIGNYADRLFGLSGQGLQGVGILGNMAAGTASGIAGSNTNATNMIIGSNNQSNQAIQDLLSNAMMTYGMSQGGYFGSSLGGGGGGGAPLGSVFNNGYTGAGPGM